MGRWSRASAAAFAALLLLAGCGGGDGGTDNIELVYLGTGGLYTDMFTEKIFPLFEEENPGITVKYEAGTSSTDNIAKVIAQQRNPQVDIVQTNDVALVTAKEAGVLTRIDPAEVPNYADVYDILKDHDDMGAPQGISAVGLVYNTEMFEDAGLPPPTSWYDLWDPAFRGKTAILDIAQFGGYAFVPLIADLESGDPANLDAGFAKLQELKPNLLNIAATSTAQENLLQTNAIMLGLFYSYAVNTMKNQGAPLEFVYPSEGAFFFSNIYGIPEDNPGGEAAQDLLNFLLEPKVQAIIAESVLLGPSNSKTELADEVAQNVPYGADSIQSLYKTEPDWLSANLKEITDRWNREIAQ